jgi:hypothetical protein
MDPTLDILAGRAFDQAREREPLPPPHRSAATEYNRPSPQKTTAVGTIADELGHCSWTKYTGTTLPDGTLRASKTVLWSNDSADLYGLEHPSVIPVYWEHDRTKPMGRVVHLERRAGRLRCVAELDLLSRSSMASPCGGAARRPGRSDGAVPDPRGIVDRPARERRAARCHVRTWLSGERYRVRRPPRADPLGNRSRRSGATGCRRGSMIGTRPTSATATPTF